MIIQEARVFVATPYLQVASRWLQQASLSTGLPEQQKTDLLPAAMQ